MFAITPRLLLRPSWPEDAATLHGAIADKGIVRNLATVPWPYALSDAQEFAARSHAMHLPTATIWTRDGRAPSLVGACGLADRDGDIELGYWIARPYWGQGFATEACRAVIRAAKALGHTKLVAEHFIDNPASGSVLRKLGFKATGRVELRHSKGRGGTAPSLLFERDDADADVIANMAKHVRPVFQQQIRQQAA